MVTLADRKIGTNILVNIVNLRQTVPQHLADHQRRLQEDYNAYAEYMGSRCNSFKDRGWTINIMNEELPTQHEDRWRVHPFFNFKDYKYRKFIPEDEIRQYQRIFVCGVFLQHEVLEKYLLLKKVNPETYIVPTLSFTQKWGYDTQKNMNWNTNATPDIINYV